MRAVLFLLVFLTAVLAGCTSSRLEAQLEDRVAIQLDDISPDGSTIAFRYRHKTFGNRIGLFEWRTGNLTTVPSPPGTSFYDSRFTADGKKLLTRAFVQGTNDLFLVNLATLQATLLVQISMDLLPGGLESIPVLEPQGDKVLFSTGLPERRLIRLDVKTGETTVLLGEYFKWAIFTPYVVGQNEIILSGMNPVDSEVIKRLESLGLHSVDAPVYRLRFGGRPELVFPTERRANPLIGNVSASGNGKTIAFIGLSMNAPYNERKQYNLEIFSVTDGIVRQHTNLKMHMSHAKVSRDASAVVFAALSERAPRMWRGTQYEFDAEHFVVELRNNKVTQTKLRATLQKRINDELGLSTQ